MLIPCSALRSIHIGTYAVHAVPHVTDLTSLCFAVFYIPPYPHDAPSYGLNVSLVFAFTPPPSPRRPPSRISSHGLLCNPNPTSYTAKSTSPHSCASIITLAFSSVHCLIHTTQQSLRLFCPRFSRGPRSLPFGACRLDWWRAACSVLRLACTARVVAGLCIITFFIASAFSHPTPLLVPYSQI